MANTKISAFALLAAVVVLAALVAQAEAAKCEIVQLMPCAASFMSKNNEKPSTACCNKLNEQKSCLCGYKKTYQAYANSPGAKRVASACGVNVRC